MSQAGNYLPLHRLNFEIYMKTIKNARAHTQNSIIFLWEYYKLVEYCWPKELSSSAECKLFVIWSVAICVCESFCEDSLANRHVCVWACLICERGEREIDEREKWGRTESRERKKWGRTESREREGSRSQTSSRPECPRTWPVLSQAGFQFTQSNWLSAPLSCLHLLAAAGVIGCLLTPRIEFLWLHVHWKSRQELFSDEKSCLRFSPQTPSETHSSTHARSQPSAWPGCYLLSCCTCARSWRLWRNANVYSQMSSFVWRSYQHESLFPGSGASAKSQRKNHLFLFSTNTELFSWFLCWKKEFLLKASISSGSS